MSARRGSVGTVALGLAVGSAFFLVALPVAAQVPAAERGVIREAGVLEARGRLDDAEAALERFLASEPGSAAALFALDRVLRAQDRWLDVLPALDRLLAVEPDAPGVRHLKLRVLAGADSTEALVRETEAWIRLAPTDTDRYREAASFWERAFGIKSALELLRRGRERNGDEAALAAEIGDLLLRAGQPVSAAAEWALAADGSAEGADVVLRKLRGGSAGVQTEVVDSIVAALSVGSGAQRMVVVRLALLSGRSAEALVLARKSAPELDTSSRRTFLEELVHRADDVRALQVILWALTALRGSVSDGTEARILDQRIADLALAAGDTAAALSAGERLARGLPQGSTARRRLLADRIRVEAPTAVPADLLARLTEFRREFPEAPELDGLSATVAVTLQRRGESAAAEEALAGVGGPRSALERAYLLLERGELGGAREAFMLAVSGLTAISATETIQLASLLGRLSSAGARVVADAAVTAHHGDEPAAARALERAVAGLPASDRPAVLAQAARVADLGAVSQDAARIRGLLVEGYPDAVESGEAALALARWHARTREGVPTAVRLLEELILRDAGSAVVPAARRELERLQGET